MAKLSNINGKFAVEDTGAIRFSDQTGTTGQILKSNGNSAPTWVDPNTVGTGPWLPLAGGVVSGATTFQSSLTVGGTISVNATTSLLLALNSTNTNGGYLRIMKSGATEFFIGTRASVSGTSGTGYDIYTIAGNDLRFFTNGTNLALTIDTSQNVGIGTDSPGYKLDVDSDVVAGDWVTRIKNDSATGYGLYVESSSNAAQYMLGLHNGLGYQFIVNGAGNVGIGTTSPSSFSGYTNLSLKAGSTGNNLDFFNSAGTRIGAIVTDGNDDVILEASGLSRNLIFKTDNAGTFSEKMRITSDGIVNVGGEIGNGSRFNIIGTTNTSVGYNQMNIANANSAWGLLLGFGNGLLTTGYHGLNHAAIINVQSAPLHLGTSNSARLTILANGDVGIGTDSPGAKLQVNGSTNFGTAAQPANTSNFINNFNNDLALLIKKISTGAGDYLSIQDSAASSKFIVKSSGNVGIGTATPSDKLQIGQGHSILVGDYFQLGSGSSDIMGALGWNRDTTNGVIYNTSFGAFQMHNNQGKLCLQGYNASGANQFQHEFYNNGNIFFNGNVGIGTTVTDGGFNVNNPAAGGYYNMSNADSGNFKYTNPNGRLLTSNGAGWVADGRDPILTLSSAGNGGATTVGYSVGLNLYSDTTTDNTYSPLICFSNQSNSGNYATAYAAIGGKKVGAGTDSNWSTGELHFWTAGPTGSGSAAYMQQASAMMIDDAGKVGISTTSPNMKLNVGASGGTGNSWADLLGVTNSTTDRAIFMSMYGGNAVLAVHNAALNAWADLYINTVSGTTGMVVRQRWDWDEFAYSS
jgi:hypothetical protein